MYNFIQPETLYNKIKQLIEAKTSVLDEVIRPFRTNEQFCGVAIGDRRVIGLYPCAVIVPGDIPVKPVMTNWTFEATYFGDVVVYTKGVVIPDSYAYHWALTKAIWEILLDPQNQLLRITDISNSPETAIVYNFNVFKGIRQGTEEHEFRSASIGFEAAQMKQGYAVM